jgi:hypothetical protein
MLRMWTDDDTPHVDFLDEIRSGRSLEDIMESATDMRLGSVVVRVAALTDVVRMKKSANRPKDRALFEILEKTLDPPKWTSPRNCKTLREQSEWLEHDMIRRRVAAPIERQMNFLRRRIGICSSAL